MDITLLTPADRVLLNDFFLLRNLPPSLMEWALTDPRTRSAIYDRNQVIYDSAHFDQALGLVLSGKVEASQHMAERELTLRLLGPGNVFGVAALFVEQSNYPVRLTALVRTRVLFFEESLLRALMGQCPAVAENYIAFLAERVHFLNRRIQSLIAGSAENLLAGFLISGTQGREVLTLDTSLSTLARRLGISRASLYRAFDALERRGLIEKSGKTITILNWDGLQTL